jgi:hypothetical protein
LPHRRACDSPRRNVAFLHYQQDWLAARHSAVGRSRQVRTMAPVSLCNLEVQS